MLHKSLHFLQILKTLNISIKIKVFSDYVYENFQKIGESKSIDIVE